MNRSTKMAAADYIVEKLIALIGMQYFVPQFILSSTNVLLRKENVEDTFKLKTNALNGLSGSTGLVWECGELGDRFPHQTLHHSQILDHSRCTRPQL